MSTLILILNVLDALKLTSFLTFPKDRLKIKQEIEKTGEKKKLTYRKTHAEIYSAKKLPRAIYWLDFLNSWPALWIKSQVITVWNFTA